MFEARAPSKALVELMQKVSIKPGARENFWHARAAIGRAAACALAQRTQVAEQTLHRLCDPPYARGTSSRLD